MTFARKLLSDSQEQADCKFLLPEDNVKIGDLIAAKEVVRRHPHPNVETDVIEIHPCTEEGKVTLETQLKSQAQGTDFFSDFFDQVQLCASLKNVEMFDIMRCSPKMGYAYTEIGGKRTHIFGTGKIIMRRADDREDALNTFSKISRVLLPARICSCGNVLADCFGGACDECPEKTCAAMQGLNEEGNMDKKATVLDYMNASENTGSSILEKNFELLDEIVGEIKKIDDTLLKDEDQEQKNEEIIEENVKTLKINCTQVILEKESNDIIIALAQLGCARDLIRAKDGFVALEKIDADERYKIAKEILFDAYSAFDKRDLKLSQAVKERYEKFKSSFVPDSSSVWTFKIATNGFYISRILGKSVPDVGYLDIHKI
jgi:ArsR family metal-binding transcriptional regulator